MPSKKIRINNPESLPLKTQNDNLCICYSLMIIKGIKIVSEGWKTKKMGGKGKIPIRGK